MPNVGESSDLAKRLRRAISPSTATALAWGAAFKRLHQAGSEAVTDLGEGYQVSQWTMSESGRRWATLKSVPSV